MGIEKKITFQIQKFFKFFVVTPTLRVSRLSLSLRMLKNYMGGLSVRDGRLVNERIGDGRTLIQAACEANKMRKQSEKTSMMTNAMVNAKMIEDSMEYGRGMMDKD